MLIMRMHLNVINNVLLWIQNMQMHILEWQAAKKHLNNTNFALKIITNSYSNFFRTSKLRIISKNLTYLRF